MGSRGKSSSQSTQNTGSAGGNMDQAMRKLPPTSAATSGGMFNSMMGDQLGAMGEGIASLISGGTQQMNDNPAFRNFAQKTGQKIQGFEQPQWLTDFAEKARGWAPQQPQQPPAEGQPGQAQQQPWMSRMSPEQQARYMDWQKHQAQYGGQ